MKRNKLTPWFPASVRPARNGVYQVREHGAKTIQFSNWRGAWHLREPDACSAAFWVVSKTDPQTLEWRGLAANPNTKGEKQ